MNIVRTWTVILVSVLVLTLVLSCTPASITTKPAEFKVNKIELTPREVGQNQTVNGRAEISNIGRAADNYTAVLKLDGKDFGKQSIYIKPSENVTITFQISAADIGEHKVEIGAASGNFAVALAKPQAAVKPSLQGIPVTLRYDNLNTDLDEYYFNQIAIWHSYMQVTMLNTGISGKQIQAPLMILPIKEGKVWQYRDSSGGYKYLEIGMTSYDNLVDEKAELNKPGWGLATTFHPDKTPFSIQNIKICGVANYTQGILEDYDNKYIVIRILNKESEVVWSKFYKWSEFRNTELRTDKRPKAFWKDVPVDNVVVNGDFTVDVLALSHGYNQEGQSYNYFAVAYEKIPNCGTAATNSFISENGKKSDPWLGLYDKLSNRVCFNLCIRVDGIN